ncbi:MAG: hydantoinase/oxoprolinase family protein [Nitrospinota bacterium]
MTDLVRIGVDVGGTFTDVVVVRESTGEVISLKVPTTPANPLEGIFQGLSKAAATLGKDVPELLHSCSSFVHGTTVCTNLMVQRAGARVGLITTEGFRDTLAIRRGIRASIWDMRAPSPPDLVPRHLRCGVRERTDSFGKPLEPLDKESVEEALNTFKFHGVEAIAICLFNAHLTGDHERAVRSRVIARMPDVPVLLSSEVHPVMGEYERVSTTAIHAYVAPGASSYLEALDSELRTRGLEVQPLILQGNGGVIDIPRSVRQPGLLILSGPAAVAAAALQSRERLGAPNLLVFDMGGTSCDVTVVADGSIYTSDGLEIEGYHLAAPSLEVTTIGTGGGSVAFVDAGGMLRVGPRGVGAHPGPVCYGRGGQEPTVTDANLVLGRLGADSFLGGEIKLDLARAEEVIRRNIAGPLGLSPTEAALAIIRIANQNTISAIEMISVRKGRDPREFTLIAAGGAGPLHASAVAEALGIARVYVPRNAAVFSALGLLCADLRRDYVRSFVGDLSTMSLDALRSGFQRLTGLARDDFLEMGVPLEEVAMDLLADLRYRGQNWDLSVALPDVEDANALRSLAASFHNQHEALYGHRDPESVIEISNLRLTAIAPTPLSPPRERTVSEGTEAERFDRRRRVSLDAPGSAVSAPVVPGDSLGPGDRLSGPAVIEEPAMTLWVAPGDRVEVDAYGNYLLLKGTG